MSGPLDGIRVLDLTRLLPGAFATALLGDLGADVIKVEQPGTGDPMRGYAPSIGGSSAFHWISDRNKRSIAVDLRGPRGVAVVLALAQRADVAVESFRPGVAERLGLGETALRKANPSIVCCSLSGYGSDGPLAQRAGHDVNYVGRAGLASVTGVDGRPAIPGTQLGDIGGALLGVAGVLAALVAAQRTGDGDHVDVSLTDAAFSLHSVALGPHFATGHVPGPGTEMLTGGQPCYQLYVCADGRWLAVGALEPHFWRNLCAAIDRPDLEPTQTDPAAVPAWRALFATRPRSAWLELLEDAETCCGPVNDLAEAIADPQLRHRAMVVDQDHPTEGVQRQLGLPIKLRSRPGSVRTPAPALGAHTRQILLEAGYADDEIEALLDAGVLEAYEERSAA